MKYLPLADLPEQIYFWRKDESLRWIKLDRHSISPMGNTKDGKCLVSLDDHEIVLSDPNWCCDCWTQLRWPPTGPCPNCGNRSVSSMEVAREVIRRWTGILAPHI